MQATTDDPDGEWLIHPDPLSAAMHATPFPDFDAEGEWQVGEAVHDINVAQIRRMVEAER